MSAEKLYLDKELSWLSFNERVLQEAADKSVPLIERIRFLGIFSNNLDEFYKVRFADVKRRIVINSEQGGNNSAKHLLSKMQSKAFKLNQDFDNLYNELILEMARRRIFLVNETQLDENQQRWIANYFRDQVLPHITPLLMKDDIDVMQFLKDEYAYIAVDLKKELILSMLWLKFQPINSLALFWFPKPKANAVRPLFYWITSFAFA